MHQMSVINLYLMLNRIKESLTNDSMDRVDIKAIVGVGEMSTLSANGSFLEFNNRFESSLGEFNIQISIWNK